MIIDQFDLKDKVTVITGSSGLLGSAICESIAAREGNLVLLDIDNKALKQQRKTLEDKYSTEILALKVDITSEAQVKKACETSIKRFKKIDGLINNAANNPSFKNTKKKNFSRLENFPIDQWNRDISISLTGAFLCSKYFGTAISKTSPSGSIINISSDLGLIAPDQRLYSAKDKDPLQQNVKPVTYSVAKTGIIGLTRYLSTYWNNGNIRSNALCPGGIEDGQPADFIKKLNRKIPLGRMAKTSDYTGIIIFLLSDSSSYMNGAVIPIDGGRTAW